MTERVLFIWYILWIKLPSETTISMKEWLKRKYADEAK